jgi:NAD(P)-dependent dehydrogenase (short-subunit alcohol dehydrogenase family)
MPAMTGPAGKVALVVGCAHERGFGRAIARELARGGADLVLVDAVEGAAGEWRGLASVRAEIEALGRRAITALADVTRWSQIDVVVREAVERFGRIDILVNNAAAPSGADRVPVVDLREDAWDAVIDTNLKGTYLCSKAVAREMLAAGTHGRIVLMASELGKIGAPGKAVYCASKFGVIGFARALALELASAGITVNAVCPGIADTNRVDYLGRRDDGAYDENLRADALKRHAAGIPLGRVATVDDVAAVVAFLCSDGARHITGEALNVSGGLVMH